MNVLKNGKFDLFALIETKMKENGEDIVWSKTNLCRSGEEGRKRCHSDE